MWNSYRAHSQGLLTLSRFSNASAEREVRRTRHEMGVARADVRLTRDVGSQTTLTSPLNSFLVSLV